MNNEASAHQRLRSLRDRIVRLEEEKKALSADIKEIYAEAASEGFDKTALRKVVKRSMMDEVKRQKEQATEEIADVYLANLGLLAGEPLNDAARQRADAARPKPKPEDPANDAEDDATTHDLPQDDPDIEDIAPAPQESNEEARERGMADAKAGLSVFKNPYIAGDPRRAFWDEGWCEEVGSDGMDVPEAWRRKSPPPKPSEQPGAGA